MIKITPQESLNIAGSLVAIGLVSILAFVTWALVYRVVPEGNANSLTLLIGILSSNIGLVVGYFFGSSLNNKKQTEALADMAKTAQASSSGLGLSLFPPVGWNAIPERPGFYRSHKGEELSEVALRTRQWTPGPPIVGGWVDPSNVNRDSQPET